MNILFTSIGRRVELVRCFRQAYRDLGLTGRIVGLDIDPLAPALQVVDRPYIVPRLDAPDYIDTLLAICRREQIDLILPLIDPDIPVLAAYRGVIEATGARLAVVPAEAAAIAADKWRTTAFFRGLGLLTPASWCAADFDSATATYPLFIKPRHGSASQHTFRLENERQARFFLDYVPDPLIQEFIAGPEITTDVICDPGGAVLAIISRQRLAVRSGEVAKGVTVHDPRIIAACLAIARSLPAYGPITVQCLLRDGQPCFTEINARLGGGVPLGIAAGVNAPLLLLARAARLPIATTPLGAYQVGLYMTRFDDSFFLTEADCVQVASRRL